MQPLIGADGGMAGRVKATRVAVPWVAFRQFVPSENTTCCSVSETRGPSTPLTLLMHRVQPACQRAGAGAGTGSRFQQLEGNGSCVHSVFRCVNGWVISSINQGRAETRPEQLTYTRRRQAQLR
jgi:hypothetical protein